MWYLCDLFSRLTCFFKTFFRNLLLYLNDNMDEDGGARLIDGESLSRKYETRYNYKGSLIPHSNAIPKLRFVIR